MMSYFSLCQINLKEYHAGARNSRKASVKIQGNPQLWILPMIRKIFFINHKHLSNIQTDTAFKEIKTQLSLDPKSKLTH